MFYLNRHKKKKYSGMKYLLSIANQWSYSLKLMNLRPHFTPTRPFRAKITKVVSNLLNVKIMKITLWFDSEIHLRIERFSVRSLWARPHYPIGSQCEIHVMNHGQWFRTNKIETPNKHWNLLKIIDKLMT